MCSPVPKSDGCPDPLCCGRRITVSDAVRDAVTRDIAERESHGIALPESYIVHPSALVADSCPDCGPDAKRCSCR